jgi:hypothetical protein
MGTRSAVATTDEEVAALTLAELNGQIAQAEWRYGAMTNAGRRKDAFKRLVWLEAQREKLHEIPAPKRRSPRR